MTVETVSETCRNGHTRDYPGPPGRSVKCRECRVSVWLKAGNARTPGAAADMAALWSREPPAGDLLEGAELAEESCPECGGECVWEGRRTLIYCDECDMFSAPRFVADRAEGRRAASRSPEGSAELAVPERSPAEQRQVAAVLAGHRETMLDSLQKAHAALDVSGLSDSQTRADAVRWRGALSSYAANVRSAQTAEELAEIREEILSLAPQFQQVAEDVRQERMRLEHLERAREYEAAQRRRAQEYEAAQQAALEAQREDVPAGTMVPATPRRQTPPPSPTAVDPPLRQ